jgi:hypothetical protein
LLLFLLEETMKHEAKHEAWHQVVRKQVLSLVEEHRCKVGLEDRWQIEVKISCRKSLDVDGLVEWIPDTYEATITICCDLSLEAIRWETIHELHELSKYRSGTIIDQFARTVREYGLGGVADLFMGQYRIARNQEIEDDVGRYLQERRPIGACNG